MCCPLRFSEVHPWKSLKFRSHFLCLRPSEMMQVNIYIQYTVTLIRLFNKNVLKKHIQLLHRQENDFYIQNANSHFTLLQCCMRSFLVRLLPDKKYFKACVPTLWHKAVKLHSADLGNIKPLYCIPWIAPSSSVTRCACLTLKQVTSV